MSSSVECELSIILWTLELIKEIVFKLDRKNGEDDGPRELVGLTLCTASQPHKLFWNTDYIPMLKSKSVDLLVWFVE